MDRPLEESEFLEHRVTDYLETFFRSLNVPYERQFLAPHRDNIIARFNPPWAASRTLILDAHQDTVPTDGMTIDPFAARIENGQLYGRGACDVKGGMASMLAAFARLSRERPRSATRVLMVCTVDEEYGGGGARLLARSPLVTSPDLPVSVVAAEPTLLNIVTTHKGTVRWIVETKGRSCHSSRPNEGINAIYRMAELLPWIERYATELQKTKTHPALGPATLSVGLIEGGLSINSVPDRCVISIDRRVLPGESADAAQAHFCDYLKMHTPPNVVWECPPFFISGPPLDVTPASQALASRLGKAIDEIVGSHELLAAAYGTDAAPLAQAGVPAVVFGPGDIRKAHTADESIAIEQVEQAAEILYRFACQE